MPSVRVQRWGGAILVLLGTVSSIWQWRGAGATDRFALEAAFLMPFCAVLGLASLVFPMSRRELLERFGVDRPHRLSHYPGTHKALFVLAILAGGANLAARALWH